MTVRREATNKIAIYGRDHGIPHCHAEGRDFRCSISIETQEFIIGAAPPAILKSACAWARAHRVELMIKWRELNQ